MPRTSHYAVAKGREVGIFSTWAECERHVKGFSGAIFKSFPTLSQAENFLAQNRASHVLFSRPQPTGINDSSLQSKLASPMMNDDREAKEASLLGLTLTLPQKRSVPIVWDQSEPVPYKISKSELTSMLTTVPEAPKQTPNAPLIDLTTSRGLWNSSDHQELIDLCADDWKDEGPALKPPTLDKRAQSTDIPSFEPSRHVTTAVS